eukprot:NODE_376_length_1419_cov_665.294891_g277_i0.p1 GENE.NODE_376_length_1419_cov_665.294891_g277_i0~~NODE_376_length_1419_cov_665.294891_g277_i0.p1  ORF type:complete len:308 (-),score=110.78 NODE_376_length_1419_cov_665.294891_g277_i0:419-1342(-)
MQGGQSFSSPEPAIKHEYNSVTKQWTSKPATVSMGTRSFQEGTMRHVFLLRDHSLSGDQECVAKLSKFPTEDRRTYFSEVEMQCQCQELATEYNRKNPPKKIQFVTPCVMELTKRRAPDNRGTLLLGVEPMLRGNYVKYSNNFGFVGEEDRSTPAAFSHYTWCSSQGKQLVCDIQGVGDRYTDPQIHSNAGHNNFLYGKGDMGIDGIRQFFASHRCNAICQFLGLAPVNNKSVKSGGTVLRRPDSISSTGSSHSSHSSEGHARYYPKALAVTCPPMMMGQGHAIPVIVPAGRRVLVGPRISHVAFAP